MRVCTAHPPRPLPPAGQSGFSLIEVLIAVMILGIGLLMIATVFPVAANWTRQSAEESVAQSVASSAMAVIRQRYAPTGASASALGDTSNGRLATLRILPGFTEIPATERSYQFGSSSPMPSLSPKSCLYFWTALVHKSPIQAADGRSVDVYVLVFHKGSLEQQYTTPAGEIEGARMPEETFLPTVCSIGVEQANRVRVGEYAFGEQSGMLYRRTIGSDGNPAFQPALDPGDTSLLVSPPADGAGASPLVYVYQTTLSF